MTDRATLAELDQRIAAVRENIRVLTEQAELRRGRRGAQRRPNRQSGRSACKVAQGPRSIGWQDIAADA